MKTSLTGLSLLAVSLWISLGASSEPAPQNRTPNGKPTCIGCSADDKTTPRTPDGHPDFSGFWDDQEGGGNNLGARVGDGSVLFDLGGNPAGAPLANQVRTPAGAERTDGATLNPSYKPEFAVKVKEIADQTYGPSTALDPQYNCTPLGVPRSMFRGGLYGATQIVQTPQLIAILFESSQGMVYRLIYMDGRGHPKDLDTSFMGDSVGHWEGDALVVDVVGLNDETWLGGGQGAPPLALIHSDKEHVVERYTRDGDYITYQAVVEDPVMFTKPWVTIPRRSHHAGADDALLESTCVPNDKAHIIKPTEADHYLCNYCIVPPKQGQ
jgi:hypothetical protein